MGQQQSNLNLNTKEILVDYGSLKSSSSLSILNRHKAHSNLIINETSLASFKSTSNNNNKNNHNNNNKKLNKFLSIISNNNNNNDNNKKNLITLRRDESKIKNRKSNKNKLITKSLIIFNNNNQEQTESIEPNTTTKIDTINSSNSSSNCNSNSSSSSNKSLNKRLNKLTLNTSSPSTHSVFCSSTPLNNNNNNNNNNNHLITTSNYRNLSYLNGLSNLNSNEPESIKSMYVQSIDDDNYLDTIDLKLKKNSKNRFSLKSTNNKVLLFNSNLSNDTPNQQSTNESNELSKDSGIISDIFGSMNNIKSRLSNAKTSLKNSFSVFSLKSTTSGSSSKDNQLTLTNNDLKSIKLKKKIKNYKQINNVESLINLDAPTTTTTTTTTTTKIDNYLTSTSIKRRSSISSATPSSYISSSVYNSSESSALSSASQSICSTSQNSHLRRTTTFHSSNTRQNLENNSFNQLNKNSSITSNTNKLYTNRTILAQPTKLITTQSFDIPNTYERKHSNQTSLTQSHRHQKIIVQASTNDLLRCFTSFLTKKCSHLIKSDDYATLSIEINNSIHKCETRDIINWLRSADRALLLQGWQEIAFMNPVNVVFVYLLVRDSLRPNELSTVYDLQCNIMACLYLAFSYMGNEISYPLKPFLIEENRSIFWSRIVSLMSQLSANMLRINRDPRFFTELFYELKSYSVQTCPLVDNVISTNNSTTTTNNNVKTVLNNGVHKSMTVNELSSSVRANLFNDIKSKKDFFCKNEDELNRMFLMNRSSCLSTFMTSKSKQNCSYLNYALTSKTSCELKNANYLYGTNIDASKQIPAYCI